MSMQAKTLYHVEHVTDLVRQQAIAQLKQTTDLTAKQHVAVIAKNLGITPMSLWTIAKEEKIHPGAAVMGRHEFKGVKPDIINKIGEDLTALAKENNGKLTNIDLREISSIHMKSVTMVRRIAINFGLQVPQMRDYAATRTPGF